MERQASGREERRLTRCSQIASEEVRPKLKMPRKTLTELTLKNRRNTLTVRYKKLNVLTCLTKRV